MTAKLTNYYMDKASELLEKEFGNNLHIAIRVENIKRDKEVTLKVGLYDGKDFLTIFGIMTLSKGSMTELTDCEGLIKTNFKDWVHLVTPGVDWEKRQDKNE